MPKGQKSKTDRPPESIVIWERPAEEVAPAAETKVPEPAPVGQPSPATEETTTVWEDVTDGNFRLLGFFLIPALLLISVLVGVGSAGSTIECGTIYEPESIGTNTIDGTTYAIYVLEDENLGQFVGGNGVQDDKACKISDLDARNADSHMVWIRTQDYSAWTECTGDVYECENEVGAVEEVRKGRFVWFAFEQPHYPDKEIDAFYTYDNQGLLGSGSFAIATLESNDLDEVKLELRFDDNPTQFCFAWAILPLGLFLVNRMTSPNARDQLRVGTTGFLRFGTKAALGFVVFVVVVTVFFWLTW